VSGSNDAERGIVRAGQPAAEAAAPTPETVLAATRLVRDGRIREPEPGRYQTARA